jgi:hypothetical protein
VPSFRYSQALTANQSGFNPLTGWQYATVPLAWALGAVVTVTSRATTNGVRLTAFAGSDNTVQRSPVQGGGTAGVTPSALNTTPDVFVADQGDPVILQYDETLGGTPTLDGIVEIEPRVG